jgi:hypothetical protein
VGVVEWLSASDGVPGHDEQSGMGGGGREADHPVDDRVLEWENVHR